MQRVLKIGLARMRHRIHKERMEKPFNPIHRLKSFQHAFAGLWTLLKTQHNAWIHAAATLAVLAMGWYVQLSRPEWGLIVLTIVAVWSAEALNTALEFLADAAQPDFHPLVKKAKDAAAGAVLITAFGAVIIGALIFIPHFIVRFQ